VLLLLPKVSGSLRSYYQKCTTLPASLDVFAAHSSGSQVRTIVPTLTTMQSRQTAATP
jgi:hypothetical protein